MMNPRPRSKKNRDLPDNLYVNAKGYYYRHPLTKKNHGMGADKARAIAAAKILNQRLVSTGVDLVAQVLGGITITGLIDRYRAEYLPDKKLSARSASEEDIRLRRIARELGTQTIEQLTLKSLTDWLGNLTRSAYIKYRGQWVDLYRFACAVGIADRNIAEVTLIKDPAEKRRKRWTLEQYRATRAAAEPWLQVAMDIALTSLQRREDLVMIRKKESFEDGRLLVRQIKTGKRLAIEIGGTLADSIAQARALHPFCPFLLGRKPERDIRKGKAHPYQITPGYLTRAVAAARDATGLFEGWPAEERPTLHELRSLGAHLYREAGFEEGYIQALLGHSDRAMTEHYLDGHRDDWDQVSARLVIEL